MKQDTKETIGSRGTVAGFRPLIGEERWCGNFTKDMLDGGWRPVLIDEIYVKDVDQLEWDFGFSPLNHGGKYHDLGDTESNIRTKRPLPPPQVETFEAYGHVWYRHVPGDKCPVENDATVECVLHAEMRGESFVPSIRTANFYAWGDEEDDPLPIHDTVVGYRFPGFPAVHTTLQQQQPIVHIEKTEQSFQHDTTKQRLLTMYHGWCDVAPDSVAECIADVAKVLYPTDADRCEAEFQKWWNDQDGVDSDPTAIWRTAWQAAKQRRQ